VFYKNIFANGDELRAAIQGHNDNSFIMQSCAQRQHYDPMPLMIPVKGSFYALRIRDDGLIVAAATLSGGDAPGTQINLAQISARQKRSGHAGALIHLIFNRAARGDHTLALTPFEPEGAAASGALPDLHRQYPKLRIHYNGQPAPITGERRYTMQYTACGPAPVF